MTDPVQAGTNTVASVADAALVQRYLDHVRFDKRLAERTVTLYTLDLDKLSQNAAMAGISLQHVLSTISGAGWPRCTAVVAVAGVLR